MTEAETLTVIIILLAGIGLLVLNQIRKNKKALLALVDKVENKIEDATGLDVELSEAVEEVIDKALDTAEEILDDVEEDGVLDTDLDEALDEVVEVAKESAEEIVELVEDEVKKMTVAQLKDALKEKGLPISGKKAELVERLLRGVA
jgi:DNA mismatch repair ATPase MutS